MDGSVSGGVLRSQENRHLAYGLLLPWVEQGRRPPASPRMCSCLASTALVAPHPPGSHTGHWEIRAGISPRCKAFVVDGCRQGVANLLAGSGSNAAPQSEEQPVASSKPLVRKRLASRTSGAAIGSPCEMRLGDPPGHRRRSRRHGMNRPGHGPRSDASSQGRQVTAKVRPQ